MAGRFSGLSLNPFHQLLLRLEPEMAHDTAVRGLRLMQSLGFALRALERRCRVIDPRMEQQLWGLRFANPIGLAAGFDKNAQAIRGLAALGFGFVEVGTVTVMPQRGNPKPRVFRHRAELSLQNCLGFNNDGVEAVRSRLCRATREPIPLGANIGKNRETPLGEAADEYGVLVARLNGLCDYFVINVSSPNTPGLRDLQQQRSLVDLVSRCLEGTDRPVLVKLAPDLEDREAVDLSLAAIEAGAAGIVATNTTVDYSLIEGIEPIGGLSGRVLRQRSREMLRLLARELAGSCELISVGGIDTPEEVYRRIRWGATLVQIYTGLVFEGPLLMRRLVQGLGELLERDGIERIEEAVGVDL